jgi:hypothetical protein
MIMKAQRKKPDSRINCRLEYDRRLSGAKYKWKESRHLRQRSMINLRKMERRHIWFESEDQLSLSEINN